MELFQLARTVAIKMGEAIKQEKKEEGLPPGTVMDDKAYVLPLIHAIPVEKRPGWTEGLSEEQLDRIGYKEEGNKHHIYVKKGRDGKLDVARTQTAMNGFIGAVLFIANYDEGMQEGVAIKEVADNPDHKVLTFKRFRPDFYDQNRICKALTELECLTFRGWKPTRKGSHFLEKHFDDEKDCKRVRFLLETMAHAMGEPQMGIQTSFPVVEDKKLLRVSRALMDAIVEAERTFEADYAQPPRRENRGGRWT